MAGFITTLTRKIPQLAKLSTPVVTSNIKGQNFVRSFSLGTQLCTPIVQHPAPDFKGIAVIKEQFKEIKLSDYKGKYVVLFFYPLDFTFVCPTEIIAFNDRLNEFEKLNTQVIGCSIDSQYVHLAWMNTERKFGGLGQLSYPLLSDINKNIAKDYGVLIEKEGIALRGTFIIDANGILRQMSINDLPVGRSVDETLRLIEAFQFVENNGEVCPANWDAKKNNSTIKPDPKGSKDYFGKSNK